MTINKLTFIMDDFIKRLSIIEKELCRLLNIPYIEILETHNTLRQTIEFATFYNVEGDFENRDSKEGSLQMLISHLRDIEHFDSELLEVFRKKLLNIKFDEYFGVRLEINVASRLIRTKTSFKKTDPPDFTLNYENTELMIECTSTHIKNNIRSNNDIKIRIGNAIVKKSKLHYCNNRCALCVDITNLYRNNMLSDGLTKERITEFVKNKIKKGQFGSVLLFAYMMDFQRKTYFSNYTRIDNDTLSPVLKKYLDLFFPFGNLEIERPFFPTQG